MTDLKTISQIAEDIGVTRQAVYSKLKYAELSNALTPYIVKRGKRTLYNLEAQNLIKQAFSASNVNSMSSECQDNVNELTKQLNEQLTILSKCKVELDKALRDNEAQTAELSQKELVVKQLTEQLTILQNENNSLQDKILDKENTIQKLEVDKDKLNTRLDKAEEERERLENNISNLTAALTAAQALHGMDKQQSVIEIKQDQEEQEKELAEDPPQQKLSFFQRLFKRSKNQ